MLFTMHATIMIFFVVMPILVGCFGNYLIPLMIGAPDMAFPKLNMLSVWLAIIASIVMLIGFFVPGGHASAGWTSYTPLSAKAEYTGVGMGMNLWITSLIILGFSSLVGSVNYITTVINMRAEGMTYFRLPLVLWSLFVVAILLLLALPVLTAGLSMLLFDRTLGTSFFLAEGGGDPLLWQHVFWFFGHPEVYVVLLPTMGIVAEIICVFSRKKLFGYRTILYTAFATGGLSFVVWAHHQFIAGIDPRMANVFVVTTILISIPIAEMLFCYIATLYGGSIEFTTPMLWGLGFLVSFLIGGVTGIYLGASALDVYFHDSYFVVAHFHYTFFILAEEDLVVAVRQR